MEYQEKVLRLKEHLRHLLEQGLCVAFSGGVDSAVLLQTAEVLRREQKLPEGNLRAVLFATRLHPPADEEDAREQAKAMGFPWKWCVWMSFPIRIFCKIRRTGVIGVKSCCFRVC